VFLVGPFGPDIDTARSEVSFARVAGKKPEQFFRDPAKRDAFGSDDRKTLTEIESRLKTEMRNGPNARAVAVFDAIPQNGSEQIVVLFHTKC
jgi:hypothetical protein